MLSARHKNTAESLSTQTFGAYKGGYLQIAKVSIKINILHNISTG